jgi:hypothetical protein
MASIRRAMAAVFRFGDCTMGIGFYRIEGRRVIAVRYLVTPDLVQHHLTAVVQIQVAERRRASAIPIRLIEASWPRRG